MQNVYDEKRKNKIFRYFGYNTFRLIQSFIMFAIIILSTVIDKDFLFSLPQWVYIALTVFYAALPIKDMISRFNKTKFKGKQFGKNYSPTDISDEEFDKIKKGYTKGAIRSALFWIAFMMFFYIIYKCNIMGKEWFLVLAAMSDFCVYFAIFFWCPFHKILLKPHCCMDCRIFNWDSFFSFSFLIFLNNPYCYILFALGVISLVQWEITYHKHPKRFHICSNAQLSCENCDMEHCKNRKEKQLDKVIK